MRTFELNKLVRDGIVDDHRAQGGEVDYDILTGSAKTKALLEKLLEEAKEMLEGSVTLEELSDIQEIIDTLMAQIEVSREELGVAQEQKRRRVGGFAGGWFVRRVRMPEGQLSDYYASNPNRFPEIKP